MWRNCLFTIFCLISLAWPQTGVGPRHSDDTKLTPFDDPKFHAGDVWQYKTRAGEEKSTLAILKVERTSRLTIVHISVENIRMFNCTGGPEPNKFEHMPFDRSALDASVTKRVAEHSPLPTLEGYEEWKAAFLQKHAGVYTISVAEALNVAEATFQSGVGCKPNSAATASTR